MGTSSPCSDGRLARTVRAGLLLGVVLWLVAAPGRAHAHADLMAADPPTKSIMDTAPSEMRFWFTEPLERFDIAVVNAAQERVDNGDADRKSVV